MRRPCSPPAGWHSGASTTDMPRINLLPWRDAQRKERKLAFLVSLLGAGVAALVTTFGVNLYFNSLLSAQESRNERLRAEIRDLDKQIEKINDLEQQKQKFIARMQIIEKLQRSRPEIVHVFDELVRTLPDGAYLTAVKQNNAPPEDRGRRAVEHPRLHVHAQHRLQPVAAQPRARHRRDQAEPAAGRQASRCSPTRSPPPPMTRRRRRTRTRTRRRASVRARRAPRARRHEHHPGTADSSTRATRAAGRCRAARRRRARVRRAVAAALLPAGRTRTRIRSSTRSAPRSSRSATPSATST